VKHAQNARNARYARALGAFCASCALCISPLASQEVPSLVVAISVDQLGGGYLDRYAHQLTGGLARLTREGAVFTQAYQDHGVTSTAPGHASILSGRYPGGTAIIRNTAGVVDTTETLVGASGTGASPRRVRGSMLFDWMKSRWPRARALGAGGDDRNVILMIGREREHAYWSVQGRFVTSTWYRRELPDWVRAFNEEALPVVTAPNRRWDLLLDPSHYPEPDSLPWENRGVDVTFPKTGPQDPARAARAFRYTPWGDSLALAFALRGAAELGLGRDGHPDLLVLGLASSDDIGHAFGPHSREVHDYILRLDRWLGVFLDSLERMSPRGLLLVLTSDHGVTPFPEAAWARGDTVPRHVRIDTTLNRWEWQLVDALGEGRYILWLSSGLVAIDRAAVEARGARLDTLLPHIARDIRRVPGVARVQTRAEVLRADTAADATSRRWRRAIEPGSQAELFVSLGRGSDFATGTSAQHGQNSELDAHVTMILWGRGIRAGRFDNRVAVVDIAPTLAHLLGVSPSEPLDGRILHEALTGGTDGRP